MMSITLFVSGYALLSTYLPGWTAFKIPIALSTTDWATLISGFGGAVVGGVIAYVIARQGSKEARRREITSASEAKQREDERRLSEEKTAALRLMQKLSSLTNNFSTLVAHIERPLDEVHKRGEAIGDLWMLVRPTASMSHRRVHFEISDFLPLMSANKWELINRSTEISDWWTELSLSFDNYSKLRREMEEVLDPFAHVDPATGEIVTIIPAEARKSLRKREYVLENLIREIYDFSSEYLGKSKILGDNVSEEFLKMYGNEFPLIKSRHANA
ncbi:hypothetical protein [Antarcticirhabdus aurantiaca]|uniref:Uncharacterized protein n=1 Tax=Antarcticirhabdus aurantiaca TaxID=2606717 RepID=A0ACD4NMB9_9HYPH|nr:hypothetical protein [Antarcticirhabdus aurantiaca]WAJ28035.1 hypothetical protein OXU80_24945 [Jeongeuplla avenae]